MNCKRITQTGFGAVAVILIVAVLAIVGLIAFKVSTAEAPSAADSASVQQKIAEPDQIKSRSDLVQTGKSLDSAATELGNDLDDKALEADINAML